MKWRDRNLSAGGDKALIWYLKRRIGSYKKKSKELGLVCDIDANYLLEIFHKQDGKCYYTKEIMVWDNFGVGKGNQSHLTLSVDRLTPSLGYTKGNIVLCTHTSNCTKNYSTEQEFYDFCERVIVVRNSKRNSSGEKQCA